MYVLYNGLSYDVLSTNNKRGVIMAKKRPQPLVKPFLKWAGGKRQLLPELRKYFPESYKNYHEPFVGAGAVLFDLKPKNAVINDFNKELINTYNIVKDDVDNLITLLEEHESNNTKEYFYEIREWDRNGILETKTDTERAARLIFLNKTCFNGLFRVNSQGQFNVPYGQYKNPLIVNEPVLKAVSNYFNKNNISILNGDFEGILNHVKKDDFIYLDPPYAPITDDSANFVGYTLNGFNSTEQERLRDLFVKLDKKGCYVMLSNSSVPLIHDLYKDYIETTEIVGANRAINSKASKRGKVDEVIIMNYKK